MLIYNDGLRVLLEFITSAYFSIIWGLSSHWDFANITGCERRKCSWDRTGADENKSLPASMKISIKFWDNFWC